VLDDRPHHKQSLSNHVAGHASTSGFLNVDSG
jgi:hypothetical protein